MRRLEIVIAVLFLGLMLGALAAQSVHDADMLVRSIEHEARMIREAEEKAAAYITTFEGLRIYGYPCGRVVVEE